VAFLRPVDVTRRIDCAKPPRWQFYDHHKMKFVKPGVN
jgi:hypothetical protein